MKLFKAAYLGDANTPYTLVTGTSIEEVKEKAAAGQNPTGTKINPDNLYGEGFAHSISEIPEGNEQAIKDLAVEEIASIAKPAEITPGQMYYNQITTKYGWQPTQPELDAIREAGFTEPDLNKLQQIVRDVYAEINKDMAGLHSEFVHHLTTGGGRFKADPEAYKTYLMDWVHGTPEYKTLYPERVPEELPKEKLPVEKPAGGRFEHLPDDIKEKAIKAWEEAGSPTGAWKIPKEVFKEEVPEIEGETPEAREEREKRLTDAIAIIDNAVKSGLIEPDMAELWKKVVRGYPEGVEVDPQEILNTYEKIRKETIDPHFAELARVAETELIASLDILERQREEELETQRLATGESIREKQAELERRGMLFAGEAVRELGAISPYRVPAEEITPTGELVPTGRIPKEAHLIATSSQARYEEELKRLGRRAEEYFGTAGVPIAAKYGEFPYIGDVTGKLPFAQEQAEAGRLGQLIGTSVAKEEGLAPLKYQFQLIH